MTFVRERRVRPINDCFDLEILKSITDSGVQHNLIFIGTWIGLVISTPLIAKVFIDELGRKPKLFVETLSLEGSESFDSIKQENRSLEDSESFYSIEQDEFNDKFNIGAIIEESLAKALSEELRRKISKLSSSQIAQFQTVGVCRICLQYDLDDSNKCLTPCSCRGSMSKVHRICLQTWLTEVQSNECEICKFKYETKRIAKYSWIGSIKAWLFNNERREETKELVHDGIVLLVVAPILICLTYVGFCVTDNLLATQIQDTDPLVSRILAFTACSTIMCTDFIATLWAFCRAQHHITCWAGFYNRSQEVVIIIDSKLPENEIN